MIEHARMYVYTHVFTYQPSPTCLIKSNVLARGFKRLSLKPTHRPQGALKNSYTNKYLVEMRGKTEYYHH